MRSCVRWCSPLAVIALKTNPMEQLRGSGSNRALQESVTVGKKNMEPHLQVALCRGTH